MSAKEFPDECTSNCKNFKSWIKHSMTIVKDDRKHFCCSVSDKSIKQIANLQTDLKTHMYLPPNQCKICCKSFTKNSDLQHHVRVHDMFLVFVYMHLFVSNYFYKTAICKFIVQSNVESIINNGMFGLSVNQIFINVDVAMFWYLFTFRFDVQ